ncbi:hypothetical protein H8S90_01145 [Olivibacter sp. SDN3]|uniref:LpxL/LpxP family acyltransferase n=1 Tax=Olivibacter sp. SDN3 TaxID=2764720 RepID=UPI00165141DF|nr:hypothetical protein [Olivibacter sp. SDN3]QNL50268.1 hypothetical protein H8S90_01145 [Olivibacter sp. SDN3]
MENIIITIKNHSLGFAVSHKRISLEPTNPFWYKFQVVSASFRNFLPSMEYNEHESNFFKLLTNQQQSYFEQSLPDVPKNLKVRFHGYTLQDIKARPGVITTFHSGSFRMVGHYLAKNDIPFVLVVSQDGMQKETELVDSKYDNKKIEHLGFNLINANDKNSLLRINRELRDGKNILVYVDGNTGTGNDLTGRNLLSIPFLNQHIKVRTGAAFISYLSKTPIYPVISTRQWKLVPYLDFFPPIIPDKESNRQIFIVQAVSRIYKHLENAVFKKPWQWETWLHLHEHADIVNPIPEQLSEPLISEGKKKRLVKFNKEDYSFFSIKGRYFLFRKSDYQCFGIERWLYQRLEQIYRREYPFTVPLLQRNHMSDLITNGIVLEI